MVPSAAEVGRRAGAGRPRRLLRYRPQLHPLRCGQPAHAGERTARPVAPGPADALSCGPGGARRVSTVPWAIRSAASCATWSAWGMTAASPSRRRAVTTGGTQVRRSQPQPWRPRFRGGRSPELHLGGQPIDLGGIGKGLALRWAGQRLDRGRGAVPDRRRRRLRLPRRRPRRKRLADRRRGSAWREGSAGRRRGAGPRLRDVIGAAAAVALPGQDGAPSAGPQDRSTRGVPGCWP